MRVYKIRITTLGGVSLGLDLHEGLEGWDIK